MPWVRIDQNAMQHPKIGGLSDGAFRLWVEALAYCQIYLTDGFVSDTALKGLKAHSSKRRAVLLAAGLWDQSDQGISVHDFLQWNDSRERVQTARQGAKDRLKKFRERHEKNASGNGSENALRNSVGNAARVCGVECSEDLQLPKPKEEGSGETTIPMRIRAFNDWYEDTHLRIFGVAYMGTNGDYQKIRELCEKFTDQQLRDAALVWFGQEDGYATTGTRMIPKFAPRVTGLLQIAKAKGIQ